ncbi:MAG: hypothetical protein ACO3I4_09045 [Candidatus Kapaibacteriota bacterium]
MIHTLAAISALVLITQGLTLTRPIKVTDTYLLQGTSRQITRMTTVDARGVRQQPTDGTISVRLDAMCTVEGVTEDGQEAIKSLVIRNAEVVVNQDPPNTLLTAGTRLKASFSNQGTILEQGDSLLSDQVTQLLSSVIRGEGGSHTGTLMNPDRVVTVGDTWQPNLPALNALLQQSFNQQPDSVHGAVSYVAIDSSASQPSAVVRLSAQATNVIDEFDGMRPSESTFSMTVTVHAPIDQRYPISRTETTTRLLMHFGEGPGSVLLEIINESQASFLS